MATLPQSYEKTRTQVAERVLIESNRQREKTASERMHEAENIERIIAEENRRKMLAGKAPDPTPTLVQGSRAERMTATKVAEAVGMKRSTHRKVKAVYDTANDEAAAAPIRAGYATPGPEATARADRRRRDLAATYRPDERLDRLLALREHDPAAYARIADPTITISLGSYAVAKAAHEEVQRDDDN